MQFRFKFWTRPIANLAHNCNKISSFDLLMTCKSPSKWPLFTIRIRFCNFSRKALEPKSTKLANCSIFDFARIVALRKLIKPKNKFEKSKQIRFRSSSDFSLCVIKNRSYLKSRKCTEASRTSGQAIGGRFNKKKSVSNSPICVGICLRCDN